MEIWKDIEGYEGLYQVSSEGRVKSLNYNRTGEEKIMKGTKNNKDYFTVSLCKEGKTKTFSIHRLVATAFLPNPNNLPQVNHRNEDKTDNRVENLEYCDSKYNNNYGTRNERISKPILQFNLDGEFIKKWDGAREVERELGFNHGDISTCCRGKIKTAYGFVWMYAVINGFTIDINKLKRVA